MPEGGFGNLIALPLQYHARQRGNSQFVDHNLRPYTDQWQFLKQLKSLTNKQLNELIAKLAPSSQSIPTQEIFDKCPPWEQGTRAKSTKINNCPKQITLTLANHIYFKLDEISSPLAAKLRRLASFSNPKFFKTQAMRFSTHRIPLSMLSLVGNTFFEMTSLNILHNVDPSTSPTATEKPIIRQLYWSMTNNTQ